MNDSNSYRDEILVVDDTPDSLRLLSDILSGRGYRVRLAPDGELALRSARAQPPALVLLDIKMPYMDGYEVCRRFKADEKIHSIPIIFLSALEDEQEKVKAFQAGGVDYINKPVQSGEVLARVKTHLELRHAQLDLEMHNAELKAVRNTLEERVKERSAELEQINRRLQQQIDEHIHTLEVLRKSELNYRRFVDTANEGIWSLDEDHRTIFVNAKMAEMLKYEMEEMTGLNIELFIFEEDLPDQAQRVANRRRGVAEQYERRWRRKDGQEVWTIVSATPIIDSGHHYRGSFAMLTDITTRKKAEEAIRNSERRLADIINLLPDATFAIDLEGKITTWNRTAEEFTGVKAEDIIGKGDHEYAIPFYGERRPLLIDLVLHPSEEIEKRYLYVKRERGMVLGEAYTRSVKGGEAYMLGIAAPLYDSEGKVIGAIESVRDITARKLAEEGIRKLNQELEQRVADRTAQLAATNKELESFSYSVSHDLRAPLRSIDGFSQALLEDYYDKIDGQGQDYLNRIRSATQRMAQLIDDMLNLSRVTRTSMKQGTVDLSAIAKSILEEFRGNDPQRSAEFIIMPGLVDQADSILIRAVLQNLLDNAWKFTSKKTVARIEFGMIEKDKRKTYYIRDNGAGFDMNYSSKLFIPFQRLHQSDEFSGLGIGLATVQRIINRHCGKIWAESEVDRGSTFYFELNLNKES